jgi:purine nucleosidase
MSTAVRSVVVDTDTGIDDSLALLYLAGRPEARIAAVTSVYGNCHVEDAVANIGYVLDLAGLPAVPVTVGAAGPLVGAAHIAGYVHGRDGLGDLGLDRPLPPNLRPESSAEYLVRLAAEQPGQHDLLVLGPMTNIALALEQDPDLLTRFRSVVLMGGSGPFPELGRVLMVDANVQNDPEAARRVFAAPRNELVMVGVNVTGSTIVDEHAVQVLRTADNPRAEFAVRVMESYMDFYRYTWGRRVFPTHDPLAAAILLHPEYATDVAVGPVNVVTDGFFTRGHLTRTADGFPAAIPTTPAPDTRVVTDVDRPRFRYDLISTLAGS